MLRKALFTIGVTVLLSGCEAVMSVSILGNCAMRPEPVLLPETLPAAKVGTPYSEKLQAINTSSAVHGIYVSDEYPLPAGLRIEHQDRDSYGLITGTPIKAGTYEVHISAGTYGTQCTGLRARRIYTLEVER